MKQSIVVGAGLPGIVASLTLAKRGHHVTLIDSAPAIGGLLRSYEVGDCQFDYGTHFASRGGDPELDDFLFGGYEDEWTEFPVLRAGNFCGGRLNSASDNPDLNAFGRDFHDRCLAEMLRATGLTGDSPARNLGEFFHAEYGATLTNSFLGPLLKKFLGQALESLHPNARFLFHLQRFAVLDPAATGELKKSARFDGRFAYHHRDHYQAHRHTLYPKHGGIGSWVDQLADKLRRANVRLITEGRVEKFEIQTDQIRAVWVNGERLPLDHLVWAAAPARFCLAAGLPLNSQAPMARSTVLVGIEWDQPLASDLHYVTNFDPSCESFRVTLYPNFRPDASRSHIATVEFMVDPSAIEGCDWEAIATTEMLQMGLISASARRLSAHTKVLGNGFPIPTSQSVHDLDEQADAVANFSNVRLIGRASGAGWFLEGLIRHAHTSAIELANQ